jgi:hypothetical protein
MKPFVIALLLACASTAAAEKAAPCLTYSGEVTLRGVLARRTYPEQPNYESIAKGDAKATYFFISPRDPFYVAPGGDEYEPAVQGVTSVQIVLSGKKDSYRLRPFLGKEVDCRGSLFHAISGHNHSPVLLSGAKCRATTRASE